MPDTFVYVKTDKAFMAGGFNTRPVPSTVSPAFQPESNMDVEGGLKSDMFDHHLRTNVALFHGWQDDVQRIVNNVVIEDGVPTGTQYVQNAGKTRTYGAELEIKAIPWTGMEITATGAYLHAAYVSRHRSMSCGRSPAAQRWRGRQRRSQQRNRPAGAEDYL